MRRLADHYQRTRAAYPEDELIVLFDIDGTILDLRYMMLRLIRRYDQERGTAHFRNLALADIDVMEYQIEQLLDGMEWLTDDDRADVAAYYRARYWERDVMFESHRPFAGVMEVMRWFDIQPGTSVGINTARPECMRADTLRSLNALGAEFKIRFADELVFMSPYPWDDYSIDSSKREGVRYFQRMGYRVAAFVDNEPANLEAVAGMDGAEGILLLHADTLFESARSRLPRATVSGDTYDITELASPHTLPRHVQFVWRGIEDRAAFARFIESGVQWCEAAVRTDPATGRLALNRDPIDETRPTEPIELADALDIVFDACRSIKLDIPEDGETFDALVDAIAGRRAGFDGLWFSASLDVLGERGFSRLRREFPDAIIQCPVDFLAPLIMAMPEDAERILKTVSEWGVDRVSISWKNLLRRQALGALQDWGWDVNIYNVPDLESFLRAALLLPTSLTADFDFPSWTPAPNEATLSLPTRGGIHAR